MDVPLNGMASPYAMAAAFGSHTLAAIGDTIDLCDPTPLVLARTSLLTVVLLWTATPLIWYLTDQPWMSHAPDFFAVAFVLWCWLRNRENRSLWGWIGFGAAIGLSARRTPNHAVFRPALADCGPCRDGAREAYASIVRGISERGGYAVDLSPSTHHACHPRRLGAQGDWLPPGSPMEWAHPAISEVLFSAHHGLFAWHPILLFGFIGLIPVGSARAMSPCCAHWSLRSTST